MLVFTPELCGTRDPAEVLRALVPVVDVIQVRAKPPGGAQVDTDPPAEARASLRWTRAALALRAECGAPTLVLVDDRVDVALALVDEGCDGVHLGQRDLPPAEARAQLGPEPLIGLSTHTARELAASATEPVDYVGFGPVFPTATKGYARGAGPEAAWAASVAAARPLFAIGGITPRNAGELEPVGRVAVCSALLAAPDPAAAAALLRAALAG